MQPFCGDVRSEKRSRAEFKPDAFAVLWISYVLWVKTLIRIGSGPSKPSCGTTVYE